MENMENEMDTDNLDLTSSYPAPGQKQQDTSPEYDSDPDLDLNETTLVSSASKVEDYKKTVVASIKEVDTLMFQRHRIATIKHSIDQVDVNSENPSLPAFMSLQLTFTARAKCILLTMDPPHWTLQNGQRVGLLSLEAVRVMRVELLK